MDGYFCLLCADSLKNVYFLKAYVFFWGKWVIFAVNSENIPRAR